MLNHDSRLWVWHHPLIHILIPFPGNNASNTGLLATLALTLTNSEVWWSLGLWSNSWMVSALSNHLAVRSLLTISFKSSALLIWIHLSIRLSSMCFHYFSICMQMLTSRSIWGIKKRALSRPFHICSCYGERMPKSFFQKLPRGSITNWRVHTDAAPNHYLCLVVLEKSTFLTFVLCVSFKIVVERANKAPKFQRIAVKLHKSRLGWSKPLSDGQSQCL